MRPLAPSLLCWMFASASRAQELRGLEDLFTPGFLVEARNGDGLADFVSTRLVLGDSPHPADIAAASDVAARLGFETMATDLPLYGNVGRTVIEFSPAGLKWDQAILQYLLDGKHAVERKGSSFFGGVSLSLDRPRPPKAEEK